MRFPILCFALLSLPLAAHALPTKPSVKPTPKINAAPRRALQSTLTGLHMPALSGWKAAWEEDALESAWTWSSRLQANGIFETRVFFGAKNEGANADAWMLRIIGDERAAAFGFWRLRGGKLEALGEPAATIVAPRGQKLSGEVSLQRSSDRARVLWNGRAVVSAWGDLPGDRFGIASHGAAKWEKAIGKTAMQSTEAPVLSDDFMRAGGPDEKETSGVWNRASGVWKTSGLLGPLADAARNPNPFVFRAESTTQSTLDAVATAGQWWWSDYAITASVRPTLRNPKAPLVAGLGAYGQSEGTRLSGEVDFRKGRATIRRGREVLVTSAPFDAAPNQWHRLYLEPGPGTIRLLVDGIERARVETSGKGNPANRDLAQGPVALTGRASEGNVVDFDDVRVAANAGVSDDFRVPSPGRWEDVRGQWQSVAGRRAAISVGAALSLTGSPEREEGLVEATFSVATPAQSTLKIKSAPGNAFGVVFAARDASNYYVARLRGAVLEIVEFNKGSGKILSSAPVVPLSRPLTEGGLSRLSIAAQWREGVITARDERGTTTTATVAAIPAGRVGAWADRRAGTVALTSFRALGAAPGWGEAALPDKFQKDPLMKNWASNATAWKRGAGGTWWHTGDFFGDAALSLPLPDLKIGSTLSLLLAADPNLRNSGSRVEIRCDGTNWKWTLSENGRVLRQLTTPLFATAMIAKNDKASKLVAGDKDGLKKSAASDIEAANTIARALRFVRRPLDKGRAAVRVVFAGQTLFNEIVSTHSTSQSTLGALKVGVHFTDVGQAESPPPGKSFPVTLMSKELPQLLGVPDPGAHPYLGVTLGEINEKAKDNLGLTDTRGALIADVEANSPAAGAKLQVDDVIRAVDGRAVQSVTEFIEAVRAKPVGSRFELQIWRHIDPDSPVDWEHAGATTSHQLDYTFTGAPVDWQAAQGRWEVAERWTCSPQWAFFVGGNAVNPTLWSRFATRGDYTFEAYLANPMDQTRGERSPVDLNLTVEGDGRDLASGYSFVFGGQGRAVNRVMRGDETAAEKPFELPPHAGSDHQDWFYVRLERRQTPQGLRFHYFVNGKTIFDYTDPSPLAGSKIGGRIAFWTYNGGLSIARARLWYSGLDSAGQSAAQSTLAALGSASPTLESALNGKTSPAVSIKNALGEWNPRRDDLLHASSLIAADKAGTDQSGARSAIRITNPLSGGDWTTFVTQQAFDAAAHPNLRFDYRVPKGVRVNLYAHIDGRWREVVFSGDTALPPSRRLRRKVSPVRRVIAPANGAAIVPGVVPIEPPAPPDLKMQPGRIVNVIADGAWHTANFDLLAALRAAELPTKIDSLAFAAPDRDYLRCGIGGNHLGATYWIANFSANSASKAAAPNVALSPATPKLPAPR